MVHAFLRSFRRIVRAVSFFYEEKVFVATFLPVHRKSFSRS
jgi:hypothetical protein